MAERVQRRWSASLRVRITFGATLAVALALVVGATAFVGLLRASLLEEVHASVDRDVDRITTLIDEGTPTGLDVDDEDDFFQVLSASGEVIASSETVAGVRVTMPDSDDGSEISIPGEDARFFAVSDEVDGDEGGESGGDGDATIIAGRSLEGMNETLATVGGLLAGAVPLVTVLVALVLWVVVGRTLAPVERMRREVDEVTATNLHHRIADPGRGDEIGRLAGTMNSMLDRLEASQHAQRRFISDASHELKSPLASLRQYAEVARSHPDRITAGDLSDAVLDEGARLERLVQGLLVLAHADERSRETAGRAVDLDDLVLAEARRVRDSTSLQLEASAVGAARIRGDGGLLAQVVRNLVDNAVQHAATRVTLSLGVDLSESGGGLVLFTVEDDGPGVPAGERERIFERFVRLDASRARASGGSGLGLAIVREIVHAHGGTVRVVEASRGGALFEVRLPAAGDSVS